jgi:methyltransferase (TIGR00027 family)
MTRAEATGPGPMALVAVERRFPASQRILVDELAGRMLPLGGRLLFAATALPWARDGLVRVVDKAFPGLWAGVMCRKRRIDEALSMAESRFRAVLNLGAGWDTRAYRLPALAHIPVWEVDQHRTIAAKQARLHELFGRTPTHVTQAAFDLEEDGVGSVLGTLGYGAKIRTVFIIEALTQYLTVAAVARLLQFMSNASAPIVCRHRIPLEDKHGMPVVRCRQYPARTAPLRCSSRFIEMLERPQRARRRDC